MQNANKKNIRALLMGMVLSFSLLVGLGMADLPGTLQADMTGDMGGSGSESWDSSGSGGSGADNWNGSGNRCREWPDQNNCQNGGCVWYENYCDDAAHGQAGGSGSGGWNGSGGMRNGGWNNSGAGGSGSGGSGMGGSQMNKDCMWRNDSNECVADGVWGKSDDRECRAVGSAWECKDDNKNGSGGMRNGGWNNSGGGSGGAGSGGSGMGGSQMNKDCMWRNDSNECVADGVWDIWTDGRECRAVGSAWECKGDNKNSSGSGSRDSMNNGSSGRSDGAQDCKWTSDKGVCMQFGDWGFSNKQWCMMPGPREIKCEKFDESKSYNADDEDRGDDDKDSDDGDRMDDHQGDFDMQDDNVDLSRLQKDAIDWQLDEMKNRRKELKRNFKNSKGDLSRMEQSINEWEKAVGKLQEALNAKNMDAFEELREGTQDSQEAVNDAFSDAYAESNKENAMRAVDEKTKQILDMERRIKELKRDLGRGGNSDTTKVQKLEEQVKEMKGFSEKMKDKTKELDNVTDTFEREDLAQEIWDMDKDFNDLSNDFWEETNVVNEDVNKESRLGDADRNMKDKERTVKELRRETDRLGDDNPEVMEMVQGMEKLLEEIKQAVADRDVETLEDLDRDFWDMNSNAWDSMRDLQEDEQSERGQEDMGRWLKDISRELKDSGKWVADLEREAKRGGGSEADVMQLQAVYDEMVAVAKKAQRAFDAKDFETAQDLLEFELDDLRQEFFEIADSLGEAREDEFMMRELENLGAELLDAKSLIGDLLGRGEIEKAKADLCLGYIEKGFGMLSELKKVRESGDARLMEEIKIRFEHLGNKADRDCGDLFDRSEANAKSFREVYIDEDQHGKAEDMFNRMSDEVADKVYKRLSAGNTALVNDILKEVDSRYNDKMAKTFEAVSHVPEEFQDEFLSRKKEMLKQVEEMEALAGRLQRAKKLAMQELEELTAIQEKVASYNFIGNAGAEMEEEIAAFVADAESLTEDEIKRKIGELNKGFERAVVRARDEKFEKGIIPFKDVDDDQWFAKYVSNLKEEGIVSGKTSEVFDPASDVRVGEIMKMSLEASGKGVGRGEPEFRQAKEHWASGYVKRAEDEGLSIMERLDNLDRPVTRSEVIRMILEANGIKPNSSELKDVESFADVSRSHPDFEYIMEARREGFIDGDEGKNTFRPDESVNRAETARMVFSAGNMATDEQKEEAAR